MPGYRIRLDLTDVARRWARKNREFREALGEELDRIGGEMEADAKAIVPVRTGYLRSTIFHRLQGLQMEFGAGAPYALYVEFGTRRMAAQPFLRPSFEMHKGDLKNAPARAYARIVRT